MPIFKVEKYFKCFFFSLKLHEDIHSAIYKLFFFLTNTIFAFTQKQPAVYPVLIITGLTGISIHLKLEF